MSVRYYGYPRSDGFVVKFNNGETSELLPDARNVVDHAPTMAWGNIMIGARESKALVPGAAQLALALLCHALRNQGRATELHQRFKMRVVAKWKADSPWSISPAEIIAVCDKIESDAQTPAERSAVLSEREIGDREPNVGVASATTSAGHRNDIPGEKVKDE